MVTYFKIGACDEELDYGKHKPIPSTIECCCCGETVVDISTTKPTTPLVIKDNEDKDTNKEKEE